MDDSERAASAVNMIEERLKNGGRRREEAQQVQSVQASEAVSQPEPEPVQPQVQAETISASQPEAEQQTFNNEDYGNGNAYDMFGQDDVNPQEAANLNDLIYNNFMQMMGLNDPKVEYPFDRSQIRYGREKTATEMLAEDEANQAEERALEEQRRRPVSAWELAQAAVDKDEEAHQKEEYEPKEMQMPETKSASQLAAEAIARKTGARGLRSIMEGTLMDTMYTTPSVENVKKIVVDADCVKGTAKPRFYDASGKEITNVPQGI